MPEILIVNIIIVIGIALLAGIFNPVGAMMDDPGGNRVFSFFWTLWAGICLSASGWFVYACVHFAQKYW